MLRNSIISNFYPLYQPRSIQYMLIGTDLDAMLSAAFLSNELSWKIAGFYDLKRVYIDQTLDIRSLIKNHQIIAVDLDIYHRSIPSVGHHILTMTASNDKYAFNQSLNPNLLRGVSYQRFRKKYPLSTIHFLRWLLKDRERAPIYELFCWLADSAYINAQNFRKNVYEWLTNFLDSDYFFRYFRLTNQSIFEEKLEKLVLRKLRQINLDHRTASVASKFLRLKGYQARIRNPITEYEEIQRLLDFISQSGKLCKTKCPTTYSRIEGNRRQINLAHLGASLPHFLSQNKVFSYAIIDERNINYTRFIKH